MKIGILADIHEHLVHLRAAVRTFQDSRVDKVVVLGDVIETGQHIEETIEVLREANVVGVWGNHDLGLCHQPDVEFTQQYGASILDFFASLAPHLELEGLLFSHGLPTWDATDPTVYYLGERPWEPGNLLPTFLTFPHRLFLIGHFHRWYLATSEGGREWDGTRPIVLDPAQRHFLIVNAVFNGWCAVFDTKTSELTPHFIG
jgi:hypothetical protein